MQAGWLGWGAMHQYCRALGKRTVYGVYFSPRHFSCSAQLLVASAVAPAAQGCTLAERRRSRPARAQAVDTLVAQLEHRRWTLWWNAAHIQEEQWVSCRAATVGCRHDGCILGFPHWARWSAGAVVASPGLPRTRSSAERCRPCLREIRNRLQRGFARQLGLGLLGAGLERIWTGMGIAGTCGVSGGIASEHTRVRADIYVCRRR